MTQDGGAAPLKDRIRNRTARVGVIGLGYVGLPLAVEFARNGFEVTGFDVDTSKVDAINGGRSYILDVKNEDIAAAVASRTLAATTDMSRLRDMDVIDICVPTPLRKTKDPDLSYVVQAVDAVKAHLKPGQLVVLESTTYPGTTDEVVQPALEEGGLRAGTDFYLAFSPERVDPGNQTYSTRTIPKVVGGVNPASTELAADLYGSVIDTVVPVSSTRVAEMVKLLENTFRAVNIGLVNEIALMSHRMNIDVWEVIDAASTKPFGFMPFYPGPGLGGHCIPIDPSYLSWKARQYGFECRFIELASHVNGSMPEHVVERIGEALNTLKKAVNGSRVHLFGVAYKKDVSDMRESPALDILELLHRRGATVTYTDPYVPKLQHGDLKLCSLPETKADGIDCAVICTNHSVFDYQAMLKRFPLIVDTRNALKGIQADHIFRL
ncbi:MAG: UDP-N-acetyl-D-glucosamine dehydrogenase [Acidobacteria bacterium RIFCSPLOWO2_12_FULL_67_14]|nr:MAG: UDP-N-acetyl-D-glucosamine dehydrogenase [Acidobacteria bacterium RIFCSPLOWO2_02_FULL_67_21]OFW34922.1 MAG: UDP-N-acetyl-D-glucosamine dehydrogenase [Acidobacteria bacterium RIFCSPLOWO2_12_FULL_67_14]